MRVEVLPTLLMAVVAACTAKPVAETGGGATAPALPQTLQTDPEFCRVLGTYLSAADGEFASLRTGDPDPMMRSWQASESLPGAASCRVADKDPTSFGSVFCVLAESGETSALESAYAAAVAKARHCLDWKVDTGEQLQTRWTELAPRTQRSADRVLQVHVRLTEAKDYVKGSVTLDVAVKRARP